MKISILTMFTEMVQGLYEAPVIKHALEKNMLQIQVVDIRDFADGSYRHIDDSPYGGGAGMILRCEPVYGALRSVSACDRHVVLMSAAGTPYTQKKAREFSAMENLVLICGHYEGVDARIYDVCDELISLGDFICTGGEFPALLVVDSIARLLDGVIKKESTEEESFENGLLEYDQYTKPAVFEGKEVPAVLRSGDHAKIREWKHQSSLENTKKYRPDLYEKYMAEKRQKDD